MATVEKHIERLQGYDPSILLSSAGQVYIVEFEDGTVRVALVGFNHVLEIPATEVQDTIALCSMHKISIIDWSGSNIPLLPVDRNRDHRCLQVHETQDLDVEEGGYGCMQMCKGTPSVSRYIGAHPLLPALPMDAIILKNNDHHVLSVE